MEAVESLKQKILTLAIQGKLVPQNASDEPASVLLQKIKAEKEQLIKAGKIKKDKQTSFIEKTDEGKYIEHIGSEVKDITDEIPFDIPASWEWCRLGDIATIKGGKRIPKGMGFSEEKTPHIYIRVTNMKNGTILSNDLKYIDEDVYKTIMNYFIEKDDLYLTIAGSIGLVGIVPDFFDGMNLTENAVKIRSILVEKLYLMKVLQSDFIQQQFNDKFHQVAQPKLSIDSALKTLIPLPPLAEQQRIVEKIEELFKQIEIVKNNQDELAKLKIALKSKILDNAIQGKLVPQNASDEPASVLLQKIKAEKEQLIKAGKIKKDKQTSFIEKTEDGKYIEHIGTEVNDITDEIPFDIPSSWEWCRLGEIINYGETNSVTYDGVDKNLWLLDLEDIEKDTSVILKRNKVKDKPFQSTKKFFHKGDVLYSKLRPYLNKVVVADEDGVCTSEILPLQIYYGIIPEFLKDCLKSHYFYEYVNMLTYGVKMPRLGTEDGKKGLIPLPPLAEQQRIVEKIEELFKHCDEL